MQLVYEVVLVNKILRNHLLSENMKLDSALFGFGPNKKLL